MTLESPVFSAESGLEQLNKFFELPQEVREKALQELQNAVIYTIPDSEEIYLARQVGGSAEAIMSSGWANAANYFAKAVDPTYKSYGEIRDNEKNSEETERLRTIYYEMINNLGSEQVGLGLRQIKKTLQNQSNINLKH